MSWSLDSGTWINRARNTRCTVPPIAFVAALQTVLRNALRGPWQSWDGSHATRPTIDGTWGPVTAAALWTLAKIRGASAQTLDDLRDSARTRAVTPEALRAGVWIAYHQPRLVDLDVGGARVQRTDPAELGTLDLEAIEVPANDTIKFGVRPALPGDLGVLGAQSPVCLPLTPGIDLGSPAEVSVARVSRTGSEVGWLAIGALALYLASRKKGR